MESSAVPGNVFSKIVILLVRHNLSNYSVLLVIPRDNILRKDAVKVNKVRRRDFQAHKSIS
jgi:hypothetical protein